MEAREPYCLQPQPEVMLPFLLPLHNPVASNLTYRRSRGKITKRDAFTSPKSVEIVERSSPIPVMLLQLRLSPNSGPGSVIVSTYVCSSNWRCTPVWVDARLSPLPVFFIHHIWSEVTSDAVTVCVQLLFYQ